MWSEQYNFTLALQYHSLAGAPVPKIKGLQTAVLHCKWILHPRTAAATLRRCQMTYSEFMLARGLPVNSGPQWGEEARRQEHVCDHHQLVQVSAPHLIRPWGHRETPRGASSPLGFPGIRYGSDGSQTLEEVGRYPSVKKVVCTCCKCFTDKARGIPFYVTSYNPKYYIWVGNNSEVYMVRFPSPSLR